MWELHSHLVEDYIEKNNLPGYDPHRIDHHVVMTSIMQIPKWDAQLAYNPNKTAQDILPLILRHMRGWGVQHLRVSNHPKRRFSDAPIEPSD